METRLFVVELESSELGRLSELAPELALRRSVPLLARLAEDTAFLEAYALPLLGKARRAENWYVAHRYEAEEDSCSLEVFVWPAGTTTEIHDHASWGAFCCAVGSVFEERYERLDDRSKPGRARLRKTWQRAWSPGDDASTVLPGDEGIHRVGNPGEDPAISLHLYGPRVGEVDGRDYDATRDYVCDRAVA
jgi:hypothetical protein